MMMPFVADGAGFFKEEGLQVEIVSSDSSTFEVAQLSSGKGDAGLIVAGSAIGAFAQEQPLIAVWEMITHPVFDLITPEGSPIKSMADLKGKNIGVEEAQSGEIPVLKADLRAAGVDIDKGEAQLVPLGDDYSVILPKLESGEIAAMSSSYNSLVQLIAKDYKYRSLLPPVDPNTAYPEVPLVVRKDLYDTNPQAVVGLARAMDKALVFARANPDAALAIMKKVFPPEHEDPAFTRKYMDRAIYMSWPVGDNQPFGKMSLSGAQALVEVLVDPNSPSGLQKSFDVTPYFTNDLIDDINNFDRAAVEKKAKESTLTYP
jgi:NitT/TauT family transport system substrate-binding protein